jgi:hypothetical protein
MGRTAVVTGVVAACLAIAAAPAHAHGGGPDAPYYRTELSDVTALPTEVTADVDPAGEWIGLTYTGTGTVIVLGYLREPYLRVTAGGVEQNTLSQTTYLNQSLFADMPMGTGDPMAAPVWQQVTATGTARWHDHRIHWMSQTRPPGVAADPGHPHAVGSWAVHALVDSTPFDIHGTINWLGRPQGLPSVVWIGLGTSFALLVAVTALARSTRKSRHIRSRERGILLRQRRGVANPAVGPAEHPRAKLTSRNHGPG